MPKPQSSAEREEYTVKLEVFFDYTCPFCYLGLHELNQLLPDYPELRPVWRPCELNPPPAPKSSRWDDSAPWLVALRPRLEEAGLPIQRPLASGNYSSLAIQGLFGVEEQGASVPRYNDAVYAAVFQDGKDIESVDVLAECAALAKADADAFRKALDSQAHRERRLALSQYGWAENALEAVPSFRLGDAWLYAAYGAGVLRHQLHEFLQKHARQGR